MNLETALARLPVPNTERTTMTQPTPLFRVSLGPLTPTLTEGHVLSSGRVIDPAMVDPCDLRISTEPSPVMQAIVTGRRACLLVEWPDLSLAYAWLDFGKAPGDALVDGLKEAYARGRSRLEVIHLELTAAAGTA